MKRQQLTIWVSAVLAVLFLLIVFMFQVRQTEIAVVTTFGQITRSLKEPGGYFRWPWPIQNVYKFDRRLQNFEGRFDQVTTSDKRSITVSIFAGWRVKEPNLFQQRFKGSFDRAKDNLEDLIRNAQGSVLSQYQFQELVSTNKAQIKLKEIEGKILETVRSDSDVQDFGIDVEFIGFKRIGLPESITAKVFDRMRAERMRDVKKIESEGESSAIRIRAEADKERQRIIAEAQAQATVIEGQGEAEAAKFYKIFQENPELAIFLLETETIKSLSERTTLILDQNTAPFHRLKQAEEEFSQSESDSNEVDGNEKP